jgi:hypothetical protein
MARRILVEGSSGEVVLVEVPADNEAQLQDRLKQSPELLPVDELDLNGPLMVVGQETPLPSGSPDLVALSPDGELVLVEFKTGPKNPDFRAALAQLLDYGSDLFGMTLERFESVVATRYFRGPHCPPTAPTFQASSLREAAKATWPDLDDDGYAVLADRLSQVLGIGGTTTSPNSGRLTVPHASKREG